jgi:anti-anti-sigma regulatory factor
MNPHTYHSSLLVGRTVGGYLVRVAGRGTMHESHAVEGFARHLLEDEDTQRIVVDLEGCDYLDSTFLGCLAMLHRRFNGFKTPRFQVAVSPEKRHRLLGPSCLDRLLPTTEETTTLDVSTFEALVEETTPKSLGRHVMECHRRLAELGGSQQSAFQSIADQMALELGEETVDDPTGIQFRGQ